MKISILSAVFNEELFLEELILSLLAQDHEDWEALFVSDGSTDRTVQLIEHWASKDRRIQVVGEGAKVGKASAFNRAYEAATGDLIVLVGGDDTMPSDGLSVRRKSLLDVDPRRDLAVAFFKIRTMSTNSAQDGLLLPRGDGGSRSGGTITLTRALAHRIFPIDERLPSEDLWLTRAAEGHASIVRDSTHVVLNYRIHAGNSNPRGQSFQSMSSAIALRHQAWSLLLRSEKLDLHEDTRLALQRLEHLERLRLRGRVFRIMCYRAASFGDRAAYAAMAKPPLFWIRKRLFRVLSGRRNR